jgi:hypothetical protein
MTCKERASYVMQTLPWTIDALLPGDEVVLLDFDSGDGLAEWVRDSLGAELKSGRVRFVQLIESPTPWHPTRAKNIAHRTARNAILCNLDADNWVVPGYSEWLRETFGDIEPRITFMSARSHGGGFGRIALLRQSFLRLGGYDERIRSWGWDDNDLLQRGVAAGLTLIETPDRFIAFRPHADSTRVFYEGATDKRSSLAINRRFTEQALASGRYAANAGRQWGAGKLRINFE